MNLNDILKDVSLISLYMDNQGNLLNPTGQSGNNNSGK
jgi:hypothetical protein